MSNYKIVSAQNSKIKLDKRTSDESYNNQTLIINQRIFSVEIFILITIEEDKREFYRS